MIGYKLSLRFSVFRELFMEQVGVFQGCEGARVLCTCHREWRSQCSHTCVSFPHDCHNSDE